MVKGARGGGRGGGTLGGRGGGTFGGRGRGGIAKPVPSKLGAALAAARKSGSTQHAAGSSGGSSLHLASLSETASAADAATVASLSGCTSNCAAGLLGEYEEA